MEAFYDSEEEIAWGPVTLKEAKDNFKRQPKIINRRHTNIGSVLQQTMNQLVDDINTKLDISTHSSEYETANESLQTNISNKNANFFEKLSKVIDEPLPCKPVNMSLWKDMSLFKHKTVLLDQFQKTLVDNTIILSSEDESEDIQEYNGHIKTEKIEFDGSRKLNTLDEVILLSDESTCSNNDYEEIKDCSEKIEETEVSFITAIDSNKSYETNEKSQLSYKTAQNDDNKKQESSLSSSYLGYQKSATYSDSEASENQQIHITNTDDDADEGFTDNEDYNMLDCKEICASFQKNVIYYEHNPVNEYDEELGTAKLNNTDESDFNNLKESLGESRRNSSPIEVPKIDIEQFDQSDDFSVDCGLNDTMEEMERALQFGLNYTMPETDFIEDTPQKLNSQPRIISGSFFKNQSTEHLDESCTNEDDSKKDTDLFKVPTTPFHSKIPLPKFKGSTPHGKFLSKFQNIVSPVRIYINNSPRMCLKQNIPDRKIKMPVTQTTEARKPNPRNIPDSFPEIIYKPAKKTVTSRTKPIHLPSNIKKLVQETMIIKHESRICNKNLNSTTIQRQLLDGNLTVEDSLLNSTNIEDVSILTSRQGFIQ